MGLLTVQRRKLTACGVKPIGSIQWQFIYRWLYGLVEPSSGDHFLLEFSHLDSVCFERFLEQFSTTYPDDLHVIQVDNAGAHVAETIEIPDNIVLLFQPPYSPEVNPIGRVWLELKRYVQWQHFTNLEDLQNKVSQWVAQLTPEQIKSLTQWDWIVDALCVAGL